MIKGWVSCREISTSCLRITNYIALLLSSCLRALYQSCIQKTHTQDLTFSSLNPLPTPQPSSPLTLTPAPALSPLHQSPCISARKPCSHWPPVTHSRSACVPLAGLPWSDIWLRSHSHFPGKNRYGFRILRWKGPRCSPCPSLPNEKGRKWGEGPINHSIPRQARPEGDPPIQTH